MPVLSETVSVSYTHLRYIEVASPIMAMDSDEVSGVILVSISTDPIVEGRQILENKADILGMAMGCL